MKRRIRFQGMLLLVVALCFIAFFKFLFPAWEREASDEFGDTIGVGLVLYGFIWRICARGHKKEMSGQGVRLVTTGPYAMIRNPMYFGTLLIGLGVIAALLRWWSLIIFAVFFLGIYIPQVNKEEKKLSMLFGEDYLKYQQNTPVYFPRLKDIVNIRKNIFIKPQWIKPELTALFLVLLLVIATELWQEMHIFGDEEVFEEIVEMFFITVVFTSLFTALHLKIPRRKAS